MRKGQERAGQTNFQTASRFGTVWMLTAPTLIKCFFKGIEHYMWNILVVSQASSHLINQVTEIGKVTDVTHGLLIGLSAENLICYCQMRLTCDRYGDPSICDCQCGAMLSHKMLRQY